MKTTLKLVGVVLVAALAICCFLSGQTLAGYCLLAANSSLVGCEVVMGD